MRFARALVDLYTPLITQRRGPPPDPPAVPPALQSFLEMQEDDRELWQFAGLGRVFNYLRRSKHLCIPPAWKPYIPDRL